MNYLLSPKSKKYNKYHLNRPNYKIKSNTLTHGEWGLIALEKGLISSNQIEALRCIFSKNIKYIGKMWIKIFPFQSLSKKIKNSRMGSGKGTHFKWVSIINPGTILFEATLIPVKYIRQIAQNIKHRLNIGIKIIYKL